LRGRGQHVRLLYANKVQFSSVQVHVVVPTVQTQSSRTQKCGGIPLQIVREKTKMFVVTLFVVQLHFGQRTRQMPTSFFGDNSAAPGPMYFEYRPTPELLFCKVRVTYVLLRPCGDSRHVIWRLLNCCIIYYLTRSVTAGFGQHGMPPPASNDTSTALGQDGSD